MIGIYKITNMVNNKSYIGQSTNIESRWKRHVDYHDDEREYPLYRAMRKYGIDNFSFTVLEECPADQLNEREKFWIQHYDSYAHGYNQTLGGEMPGYQKICPDVLEQITQDLCNFPNIKHSELAQKYNVSIEMIQGINTGRYWHRDLNYPLQGQIINKQTQQPFKYNRLLGIKNLCMSCSKEVWPGYNLCPMCATRKRRLVARPSKKDLIIKIANSSFTAVGLEYGVSPNAVVKWCKSYNLPYHIKEIKNCYKEINNIN